MHPLYACHVMASDARADLENSVKVTDDARRWSMLSVVALAELLGMSPWFAANAVATQLTSQWHLSAQQTGWLSTAVQVGFVGGTAVAAILKLPDIIESRWYFSVAALCAAAANAGLLLADSFRGALVCRLLTGVFLAGVYPPAMKMAATWFHARRGLAIGVVVGALTIGKALPYLVHALPDADIRRVILSASIAALISTTLIALTYRDGPVPFPRRRFSLSLVHVVLRDSQYRQVLGGYAGHMLELYACWVWIPAFITASLTAQGGGTVTSTSLASALSFMVIAAGSIGCVLGGELADRVGYVRLVIVAMVVSASCALLTPLVFGQSTWILTGLLLVWSIAVIADSAQFSTLVTRVTRPDAVGTALTLQTSIGFLLTTVTIQLVPVVAAAAGWRYAFPILALGPVLGITAIRKLRV